MTLDQDICATCDMNSTLGSVVPLAMFHWGTVLGRGGICLVAKIVETSWGLVSELLRVVISVTADRKLAAGW